MAFVITGFDKTKIQVDSSDIQVARKKAAEYLDPWTQKGDQVIFFRGEKEGIFIAVVCARGEETDAHCKIEPQL